MALFGKHDVVASQALGLARFPPAWDYVREALRPGSEVNRRILALVVGESGRFELGGGLFALEQSYETRDLELGRFESHERYWDIQLIVSGSERILVSDRGQLTAIEPYQSERDVALYEAVSFASTLCCSAGDAAVFAPQDAHMPCVHSVSTPARVFKTVVKVPVSS